MPALKTTKTAGSVAKFLNGVADPQRREDCLALLDLMRKVTKCEPRMWGAGIVGFGDYHYKYASGREGDWFLVGFSPRKQDLTLYLMGMYQHKDRLKTLGKHRSGVGCLYIKSLADVDRAALKKLIRDSMKTLQHLAVAAKKR